MVSRGPDTPEKILLIRPSALGDVCRTVPVLASLRAAYPDAQIDWMVRDTFADAIEHHPALSSPIYFPRQRFGNLASSIRLAEFVAWESRLRQTRYDMAIDCQGLARSGLFSRFTRAPRRIGMKNAREFAWLGYNERHAVPTRMHTVDRMLTLLEKAGIERVADMRIYPGPSQLAWADETLEGRPTIAIAPTSRWAGKRWPIERFVEVAREILASTPASIAVLAAESEREQCTPLLEMADQGGRVIDLVGRTTIGRLLGVIARSSVLLGNDSAAIHMAVGLDRPLVALYGPTRADLVGPYQRERDVIQHINASERFNHKDASHGQAIMQRITAREVADAVLERYAASTDSREAAEPDHAHAG